MSIAQTEPGKVVVSASHSGSWNSVSHRDRFIAVLVFVMSLAYLRIFRHYTSLEPVEGIVLQGAQRILRGEVPSRDFFSFYTPGSVYLVAFLFEFSADLLVVARLGVAV